MNDRLTYGILLTLVAMLSHTTLSAQPKSAGATFCFSGIGLSYEYATDPLNFIDISIRAEMSELFLGREEIPGCSVSFTWNTVLNEWNTDEGDKIRFFIGPGAALGLGKDFKTDYGFLFGLKGKIGMECIYRRGICISASLSPILGQHVVRLEDKISMRGYRNGIIYGFAPEVGIKYCF